MKVWYIPRTMPLRDKEGRLGAFKDILSYILERGQGKMEGRNEEERGFPKKF